MKPAYVVVAFLIITILFGMGYTLQHRAEQSVGGVENTFSVDRVIDTEMNVVCYRATTGMNNVACLEIPKLAELPRPRR